MDVGENNMCFDIKTGAAHIQVGRRGREGQ